MQQLEPRKKKINIVFYLIEAENKKYLGQLLRVCIVNKDRSTTTTTKDALIVRAQCLTIDVALVSSVHNNRIGAS